jgi:tRNA modification GTPase
VVLRDRLGHTVERGMAVLHPAPRSYTGEDVVEISCHGNPVLVDAVMDMIAATGLARMAHPGEFTRRAFMNGKMDLAQAEAVGALIEAGSTCGIHMAGTLLSGDFSRRVRAMGDEILGLVSGIEASFLTDDAEPDLSGIRDTISSLNRELDALLAHAEGAGRRYSGIVTTIAGLPNVGKSSLFNAILGYPRAIVHEESGTTRDVIREHLVFEGTDFLFHDTAGIRETSSGPEQAGIEKTIEIMRGSHLVLYVVDATLGLSAEEEQWLDLGERTLVVMNKADLLPEPLYGEHEGRLYVSAKLRLGIRELLGSMAGSFPAGSPGVFLARHTFLLSRARENLGRCLEALDAGMTPDVLAMDLSAAMASLREISGDSVGEDVLDRIFSEFCVGK